MAEPRTRFRVGPHEAGKRLDRFLHERMRGLSRARVQQAIRARVSLSWRTTARPSTRVAPGGEVRVRWSPPNEIPLDLVIPVLRRGEGWLAVDKPAGLLVHPASRVLENTLVRMIRRQEGRDSLRLVHRLDRDTSGAILLASDEPTSRALARAFETGRVHKEYLALVSGVVEADEGVCTGPIGAAERTRVHVRLRVRPDGRAARTEWRVERRMRDRTLLRVFPRTGRRHQIRVHLANLGHPVLGDVLYGQSDEEFLRRVQGTEGARANEGGPPRHLLHCAVLGFPDPVGEGTIQVLAPDPRDFAPWLSAGS